MVLIGKKQLEVPIIQGGMGVGVSLGRLAGAVAHEGAMGVISSVNAGYREPDFDTSPRQANIRALNNEIKNAFSIAEGKGLVAVNIMVAVNYYEDTVKAAVAANVDAIISGAGLPLNLPELVAGSDTAIAPIVSSGKAAAVICKSWDRRYSVIPDFIVIEGPMAGGHLGFEKDELINGTAMSTIDILPDVLKAIRPYEEKYERKIPVFVAGGVFDGNDMRKLMSYGASGIQMATRFIATHECDASDTYKQMMVDAKEEDAVIIKSPVGLPGRALETKLIKELASGKKFPPLICNNCLRACPHSDKTPYCISRALVEAVKGNKDDGLFFCGANVGRVKEIVSVKELIDEIMRECMEVKTGNEC